MRDKRMMRIGVSWLATFALGMEMRAGEVQFNRDIRPIFTKHCTACHGGVKEAGGISFVYRERLVIEGDTGNIAVVAGKPEDSEVMRRVRSRDPDIMMPQPKHGSPLADEEVAMLAKWIEEGAVWEEHWAFMPPKEVAVEGLKNTDWPTVSLDDHVLRGIEAAGLEPSEEATAAEWLRRVSFDLVGLPPDLEVLANLENEWETNGARAREQIVDALLSSPSYGEKWAAMWLDLARYSDTYGFERDPHRDIWPYRDWVVRAFNKDMPYDRFTIEQLAGDLLPGAGVDQHLATAFNRNTQTNTEGGTDDEEFRVAAVLDRLHTVWTTWQATTFACVQCHAHPYDPITHEEFYEFKAFFNNTEDSDLNDDFPKMKIPHEEGKRGRGLELELALKELRNGLNSAAAELAAGEWSVLEEMEFNPQHGTLNADSKGMIVSEGTLPFGSIHRVSGRADTIYAIRLSIFPKSDDPADWPEMGAMVTQWKVEKIGENDERKEVPMGEVFADYLVGPFDPMSVLPEEEFKRFHYRGGIGAAGGVGAFPKLNRPRWFVFLPKERLELAEGERIEISMVQNARAGESQGTHLLRFMLEVSEDDGWRALLADEERQKKWAEVIALRDESNDLGGVSVPVMRERLESAERETRIFARGNRTSKEDLVEPRVPELLAGSFAGREGMTRLDMAEWMMHEDNPLTARVMVNRLWSELFGIGIVETTEDFGTSGSRPSDLALLDHLALRFQGEHGWSVKKAVREMVLSSTYRQTHRVDAVLLEKDPKNQLFARGPRNRLTAEMIRDQVLAVSGLLSEKRYGPSVFPPQPEGVWSSVYSGATWKESKGEDRYRRGIYTYSKRTSGFPGFLSFDAPSRDVCSARRIVSNTPLQALVTMNDPAHVEAAAAFAKRVADAGGLREQLAQAVLLATQKQADEEMLDELEELYADLKAAYADSPDDAKKLEGDAAMVLVMNTLMNLDATLTK